MEGITYIVFICFAIPFALALPLVNKRARPVIAFLLIGTCVCLFISEINGLILNNIDRDIYYVTTNITPVTEEIIKAIPIFIYAFCFSKDRNRLITIGFACGLGFSLMENSTILVQSIINYETIDIAWALVRTLGAGLLHGLCCALVAVGVSLIGTNRKFFVPGTIGLLEMAIVYHSIYNSLIQSDYKYIGAALPMATYLVILTVLFIRRRKTGKSLMA